MANESLTDAQVTEHTEAFNAETNPPSPEPELILGKFKSQEDLAAAYKALESKLGSPDRQQEEAPAKEVTVTDVTPEDTATLGGDTPNPVADVSLDDYLSTVATGSEVDAALREQVMKAHSLTADTLSRLESGAQRDYSSSIADIYNKAGGKEKFAELNEYVKSTYSDAQIKALDKAIKDPATRDITMTGLLAQMGMATPTETPKNTVQTTNVPNTGAVKPYTSQQELTAAMQDPAYLNPDHPQHANKVQEVHSRYAASGEYLIT